MSGSPEKTPKGAIQARLSELNIVLPKMSKPVGSFDLGVVAGDLLFISGQGPLLADGTMASGKVGADVSLEQATQHARCVGLVILRVIQDMLGDLDGVERIVKVCGMVNAVPDFTSHTKVINGCSDLFCEVFGARGRHARYAVGMGSLPGNITVEIDAVVAIKAGWQCP